HRCSRREARAVDRAEAGASGDRRNRESSSAMPEEPRRESEEIAARTGDEAQVRHQHEQRQRAELVARHRLEDEHAGLDQRGLETERKNQAAEPGDAEGDADRHAGEQQDQKHDHAGESQARLADQRVLRPSAPLSDSTKSTSSVSTAAMRSGRYGMPSSSLAS